MEATDKSKVKNKILFVIPPFILAVITWIWLFYKDGRWYYYRKEWPWSILLCFHLLMILFYFISGIVVIVRQIVERKKASYVYYIVSSIILFVVCIIGFLAYAAFTSGM
ncbi:MAG: hypothetical protein K6G76_11410 [Lachnospiraceae bacterium]|nr:hypothetical protein [Lachnospiraceae bacterium]